MIDYKFTIFTPCYNCAKTIHRVFEAVAKQTYVNFEWIIVNDGSKDDSDSVIKSLIELSPVKGKIQYVSQENLGKHRAWNRAAKIATGELFLCADADDGFTPTALEFFNRIANEIGLVGSMKYCSIAVCAFDHETGQIVGTQFPESPMICDDLEMAYKYQIRGDKWMCNRTDLIKREVFPDIPAPYYPETRLFFAWAKAGYKIVCHNQALLNYYLEQTSLCHGVYYKFNARVAIMKFDYFFWVMRHVWWRIFRLNKSAALGFLVRMPIANSIRLIAGCIVILRGSICSLLTARMGKK